MNQSVVSRPLNHELELQPILTINVPQLEPSMGELHINLKDRCYVGSYNWAPNSDSSNPTILVPGSPPEWVEPNLPISVDPDIGPNLRDQNGHMSPGRPLLPLVAAVVEQNVQPAVVWKDVDFVSDRNVLRKLLRWVRGTGRDFRIDTELFGKKTIFLNRWEQKSIDYMSGNTYGFNFEKAATKPAAGCEGTTGHARIISYDFDGLKMIVQFKVDAYLPERGQQNRHDATLETRATADFTDGVRESLSNVNVSGDPHTRFGLGIVQKGTSNIPDSSIIELATTTRKLDWKERYPQLFFSQTPHHFLAWHDQLRMGTFTRIDRRTLSCPLFQAANTRLQPAFQKLRAALDIIGRLVIEHGHAEKLTLLCVNKQLVVYRRENQASCLPDEAAVLFQE